MIKLFCRHWHTLLFTLLCISRLQAQIDVLHYKALIEPDIQNKSIKGKVIISFSLVDNKIEQVSFSCSSLVVDSVLGNKAVPFYQENNIIYIKTPGLKKVNTNYEVEIIYHGKPARGVQFFPDLSQVYTIFGWFATMPLRINLRLI
ncbi:MAG TPA: hypothetical protein VD908_06170 [Cytophagales bacterium]|nr:hypothetical protein [Cytophagales bacterium]